MRAGRTSSSPIRPILICTLASVLPATAAGRPPEPPSEPADAIAVASPAPVQPPSAADPVIPMPATLSEADRASDVPVPAGPPIFGLAGLRGFGFGQQVAPNGLEFNPLFSLDLEISLWLWRDERLYAFSETRFWGQKPAPGVTNPSQGIFDFSKREFDLELGVAWNYYDMFEARTFAYSFNNLNRGSSAALPSGYADGVGIENRLYVGSMYANLGLPDYDVARAPFLGFGFYPTKDMVDCGGNPFKPGPFARAYFLRDLTDDGRWYLYADNEFTATRSFTPKLFDVDFGIAVRPFTRAPCLEFRLGSEDTYDLQLRELETSLYLSVRIVF